jgi:predicted transcriptional regulator
MAMGRWRKQRRLLAWTQHDLARAARISRSRIAFAETGRIRLTDVEIERIKRALARRAEDVAAAISAA